MYRGAYKGKMEGLAELLDGLGEDVEPVLERALELQAKAFGVPRHEISVAAGEYPYAQGMVFSEVLAAREGIVVVELQRARGVRLINVAEQQHTLMLYGIGRAGVGELLQRVIAALSERYGVELEEFRYHSSKFEELTKEGMTPPEEPTPDEAAGARLLADPAVRRIAIAIASSGGGLLVADLNKQISEDDGTDGSDVKRQLESANLASTELVVICKRSSSQVLRAPSQEALEKMAAEGARCACGAALMDERVESAVDLTELARKLLNGSWWMSVSLMENLRALGVPLKDLVIEQKSGGEEMDCFANISGELCLFELKDKEFSLGNAYSFGAKVGIYTPERAIVITTAYVGGDAKEHFQRAHSADRRADRFGASKDATAISYIEGTSTLRSDLEALMESIYMVDANAVLRRALPHAAMDSESLAEHLRADASSAAAGGPGLGLPDKGGQEVASPS